MFETADGTGEMARKRKWSWVSKGKIETIKLMKPEFLHQTPSILLWNEDDKYAFIGELNRQQDMV